MKQKTRAHAVTRASELSRRAQARNVESRDIGIDFRGCLFAFEGKY